MMNQEDPTPNNSNRSNWLRRLLRRWLVDNPGDTIAADIGEGAQGVAVGKNIIQIGALKIPLWLALAVTSMIAALFQGRLIARAEASPTPTLTFTIAPTPTGTPTPTPTETLLPTATLFPPAAEDETLVLVADVVDAEGKDPRFLTKDLFDYMQTKLADHERIRVVRWKNDISEENGRAEARKIGQDPAVNATIVIWGHYVSPLPAKV
jgi:hypothetical protein